MIVSSAVMSAIDTEIPAKFNLGRTNAETGIVINRAVLILLCSIFLLRSACLEGLHLLNWTNLCRVRAHPIRGHHVAGLLAIIGLQITTDFAPSHHPSD